MEKLPKNLRLFVDDDDGFIRWCYDNPDGFFWNCYRKADAVVEPYMLHSAIIRGKLCQHFRNSSRASGFTDNLTTDSFCKVCSVDRKALEEWAQGSPHSLDHCTDCIYRLLNRLPRNSAPLRNDCAQEALGISVK